MRFSALILILLLTSCAGGGFSLSGKKVEHQVRVSICPPVREYPAAVQRLLAQEIETCTSCTLMIGAMKDFSVMRDQARVCRAH